MVGVDARCNQLSHTLACSHTQPRRQGVKVRESGVRGPQVVRESRHLYACKGVRPLCIEIGRF